MSNSHTQSPKLKVGCQTYTWEMLGTGWTGEPDDLLAAIAGVAATSSSTSTARPSRGRRRAPLIAVRSIVL